MCPCVNSRCFCAKVMTLTSDSVLNICIVASHPFLSLSFPFCQTRLTTPTRLFGKPGILLANCLLENLSQKPLCEGFVHMCTCRLAHGHGRLTCQSGLGSQTTTPYDLCNVRTLVLSASHQEKWNLADTLLPTQPSPRGLKDFLPLQTTHHVGPVAWKGGLVWAGDRPPNPISVCPTIRGIRD